MVALSIREKEGGNVGGQSEENRQQIICIKEVGMYFGGVFPTYVFGAKY